MRTWFLALVALSCEACKSCTPSLPDVDDGNDSVRDSAETGDSTPPIDTSPPPPCDFPEVEPNDYSVGPDADPPNVLAMEKWACGNIDTTTDTDRFLVTAEGPADWIRFDVVASQEGSSLDASLLLLDDDYGAAVDDSDANSVFTEEANDPVACFPAPPMPHTFDLVVRPIDFAAGKDDYHWKLRASVVKAPLSWDLEEIEVNDPGLGGTFQTLASGERVFGRFSSGTDVDAFLFDVPKVSSDQKVHVTADVDGFRYGSPIRSKMSIVSPTGEVVRWDRDHDEFGRPGDPNWEFTPEENGPYMVFVELREGTASLAGWYVLSVTVEVTDSAP
jgi:hypothetical protein